MAGASKLDTVHGQTLRCGGLLIECTWVNGSYNIRTRHGGREQVRHGTYHYYVIDTLVSEAHART
eukprot:1965220-Prymnesium_polylepis.1